MNLSIRLSKSLLSSAAVFALVAVAHPLRATDDAVLKIEGSSSLVPYVREALKGLGSAQRISIPRAGAGTKEGIACAKSGACQLGLASRALTAAESEGLVVIPIGWEATVIVTSPDVPVADLTTAQVKGIFEGKITNWKDVGGPDQVIAAFQRDPKRGAREIFDAHFKLHSSMPEFGGNAEEIHRMRSMNGAISYLSLGVATEESGKSVRIPKLDGVEPSLVAVRSGKWPLRKELLLLEGKEAVTDPRVKAVVDRILERRKAEFEKFGFIER